jgi:hypothetical protein
MTKLIQQRKAQIKEALNRANNAYKAGDFETALKLLTPYRNHEKVQFAIEKIESAKGKKKKGKAPKVQSELTTQQTQLLYGAVAIVLAMACLLATSLSPKSETTESEQAGIAETDTTPTNRPNTASPSTSRSSGSGNPRPTQAPIVRDWDCSRDNYDCNDFSTCTEVMSYWNVCRGDPSELDHDSDGQPCESMCGG